MNNCPNCGSKLEAEAKVCPVCGYVLQQKIPRNDLTAHEESDKVGELHDTEKGLPAGESAAVRNETEQVSKIASASEFESERESEQEPEAEPASGLKSESDPESEPELEPKSDLDSETAKTADSQSAGNSDAKPKTTTPPKTFKRPDFTVINGGQADEAEGAEKSGKTASGPKASEAKAASWENLDLPAQFLGYFRFLNQHATTPQINPTLPDSGVGKWYPLVSFLLLVFSNGFALSRLATGAIYQVLGRIQSFGLQFRYTGSGVVFFVDLTLYLFVAVGLFLVAYYLVATKVFGRPVRFLQAMGEILAPASLAVYLSVLAAVLAPWLTKASLTCVVASLLLISVSFMGNLWQTPNRSGRFNRFYTILLTILLCLFVLSVVTRFFVEGMIQDLPIQQVPTGIEDLFGDGSTFY